MRIIKCLLIVVSISLFGCSSSSSDNSFNDDTTVTKYDNATYKLNEFSIASLDSSDSTYLALPPKLNSWLISNIGGDVEISLKLRTKVPRSQFNDPSVWAFFIRTDENPIGIKYFDELEVRLFYNYSETQGLCCTNTLPLGSWDQAELSYIPVGGYVDFVSDREGVFSLEFQQATELNSDVGTGQIVNVKGCWRIPGEGGVPGCSIQ